MLPLFVWHLKASFSCAPRARAVKSSVGARRIHGVGPALAQTWLRLTGGITRAWFELNQTVYSDSPYDS